MLFIINDLKYDTDKMELISNKCKWQHEVLLHWNQYRTTCDVNAILYKSIHNRWLATYKYRGNTYAVALNEKRASNLLKQYDFKKYEQLFGELEEA